MSAQQAAEGQMTFGRIRCGCGGVELRLPNPVPKFRCGCCCSECLQRAYIGANGTPPAPIKNLQQPIDLLYVDSQIMKPDARTLAKLSVFRLNTPDAANINLRATCCGAVLLTENQPFHVPHSMATFNNLQPALRCDFNPLPESKLNVWTKDWPAENSRALAEHEASTGGSSLPQIFDVATALEEPQIIELAAALQVEASAKPDGSISFAELCNGMRVSIERAFFDECRAHLHR